MTKPSKLSSDLHFSPAVVSLVLSLQTFFSTFQQSCLKVIQQFYSFSRFLQMSSDTDSSPLYLGLDLSTQQLKAIVINEQLQTVADEAISFNDKTLLAHHVQPNGFVIDPKDKRCVTTPAFVFLEALGKTIINLSIRWNNRDEV